MITRSKNVTYLVPSMFFYNISLYIGLVVLLLKRGTVILAYACFNLGWTIIYDASLYHMIIKFYEQYFSGNTEKCDVSRVEPHELVLTFANAILMILIGYFALKLYRKNNEKELIEYLLDEYTKIITQQQKLLKK